MTDYSRLTVEQEKPPTMTIEENLRLTAEQGNLAGMVATMALALDNPESNLAREIESAGLRVLAYDFFSKTKTAIDSVHSMRPEIADSSAGAQLNEYEEKIKSYLEAHNNTWHELVGEVKQDPVEATKKVIHKIKDFTETELQNKNESKPNRILIKSFSEIGNVKIGKLGLRDGIALNASDIVELIWGIVHEGRDAEIAIDDGHEIPEVSNRYMTETDRLLSLASSIASDFMEKMDNPPKDQK